MSSIGINQKPRPGPRRSLTAPGHLSAAHMCLTVSGLTGPPFLSVMPRSVSSAAASIVVSILDLVYSPGVGALRAAVLDYYISLLLELSDPLEDVASVQ